MNCHARRYISPESFVFRSFVIVFITVVVLWCGWQAICVVYRHHRRSGRNETWIRSRPVKGSAEKEGNENRISEIKRRKSKGLFECYSRPSTMPFGWSPSSNTTSTGTNCACTSTSSIDGNVGVFGEWSAAGQRDGIAYRPCVPRTRQVMYLKSVDNPIWMIQRSGVSKGTRTPYTIPTTLLRTNRYPAPVLRAKVRRPTHAPQSSTTLLLTHAPPIVLHGTTRHLLATYSLYSPIAILPRGHFRYV